MVGVLFIITTLARDPNACIHIKTTVNKQNKIQSHFLFLTVSNNSLASHLEDMLLFSLIIWCMSGSCII